jgi:predicted HTH transcriptional regulator
MSREANADGYAQISDQMYTANANRAETGDLITPDNFRPNPKNPIIAAFFRNIWLADELGSGVRNLYRYGKLYSGKEPRLIDGDVFRIIVPLDDAYSFDAQIGKAQGANSNRKNCGLNCALSCTATERRVLDFLKEHPAATHRNIADEIDKSVRTAQSVVRSLREKDLLTREGARNSGRWVVTFESGKDLQLTDDNVFQIFVPPDEAPSFDAQIGKAQSANSSRKNCGLNCGLNCTATERRVLDFLKEHPAATHRNIADEIDKSIRTAQSIVRSLREKGFLTREGSRSSGRWVVMSESGKN